MYTMATRFGARHLRLSIKESITKFISKSMLELFRFSSSDNRSSLLAC